MDTQLTGEALALSIFAFVFTCIAAWATHVIVCLQTANWGFLIAGAILAPIGVVHGAGIWFGAF